MANLARLATAAFVAVMVPTGGGAFARSGNAAAVDPYIGVDWAGRVFLGAAVPYGMVKLGPDMVDFDGHPGKSGYLSSGEVLGFSHLHLTGAAGKYGNILVMPQAGPLAPADLHSPRTDEQAAPGFYAATLTRGEIGVALTATRRVGVHRYVFGRGGASHIVFDLSHLLTKGKGSESQKFLGGSVKVDGPTEIEGVQRVTGGWNEGGEYDVYFDAVVSRAAAATHVWADGAPAAVRSIARTDDGALGASFDYDLHAGDQVELRVGISYVSVDDARQSIRAEAGTTSFDRIHAAAMQAWNRDLSPIDIAGATDAKRRQFYTALYHTMLMPSDLTGEVAQDPQHLHRDYGDFYTLWDLFRTSFPLMGIIEPDRERDMILSLLDDDRADGYIPDARSGGDTGRTQGGSNADIVLADAMLQGLPGIDWKEAYAAVRHDADVEPKNPLKWGRGGLDSYIAHGYVAQPIERAGTRTVEYAYNDFAAAEMACRLAPQDAARYAARAGNWTHLWDPSLKQLGVPGFIRPRNADGSWAAPDLTKRGEWPNFFYEDDLWTYSLYAPGDVRKLIALSGGNAAFVHRLDVMFGNYLFDMTNEPGFLIPMLYVWAGRPDLTADRVHEYLEKWFEDSRGGLPANDDSGAMSSWFVFQSMGIYPLAGQDVFLIGTPSFTRSTMHLPNGRDFTIAADNLDAGGINRYVQSATLNGHPLDNAWFRGGMIRGGGELHLTMGPAPSAWGRTVPPPSQSDPGRGICDTNTEAGSPR